MSAANYLTIFRLFVSPIFFIIYVQLGSFGLMASLTLLLLLIISEITDLLDGYIARRYNQVTDLGKILDPMADSIVKLGIFFIFTLPPLELPMPIAFIFLYRDSMISSLRTLCALRGFTLAARKSGKIKAVVQAIAAFATILALILYQLKLLPLLWVQYTGFVTCSFAALFSVLVGFEYLFVNKGYIKSALTRKGA